MLTEVEFESTTEAIRHDAIDACGAGRVVPLSEAYLPPGGFYDEMFTAAGSVRPHCLGPARMLLSMTPEQLAAMRTAAERMLLNEGVTSNVYSGQAECSFPFDVMPRIIDYET